MPASLDAPQPWVFAAARLVRAFVSAASKSWVSDDALLALVTAPISNPRLFLFALHDTFSNCVHQQVPHVVSERSAVQDGFVRLQFDD